MALASCETINPIACTEEFVSVRVEVSGAELGKTYSFTADKDTLHQASQPLFENFYTVADDMNQDELEGKEVNVTFHGYIGDSLAVEENYVIGADKCHIFKVSGKEKIEL